MTATTKTTATISQYIVNLFAVVGAHKTLNWVLELKLCTNEQA